MEAGSYLRLGSVLGPVFFTLFINDLIEHLSSMFSDSIQMVLFVNSLVLTQTFIIDEISMSTVSLVHLFGFNENIVK